MEPVFSTAALVARGFDHDELRRLRRTGELQRVRRGSWTQPLPGTPPLSRDEAHRRHVQAVVERSHPEAVVSHGSAAALHGLPVWTSSIEQVHLTRDRRGGARQRAGVSVHGAPLPAEHLTTIDGIAVTTLERTVADLGRTVPLAQAVAAADRAAQLGLDFGLFEDVLVAMAQWPGVRQARRVWMLTDARSESVGESVSRVRLWEGCLPSPVLQYDLTDALGVFLGRGDFVWVQQRVIGEFDGMTKYTELVGPGRRPEDVVIAEKLREDRLRAAGWVVVRWVWSDLDHPGILRAIVVRGFQQAGFDADGRRLGRPLGL